MKINKIFFLAGIFILFFLLTRIPYLGKDEINPDAVNWHYRSEQFIVGLKTGQLEKTYQHYHPGVTLMWIMGVPIEVFRQLYPETRVYTHLNFLTSHTVSKYALVSVQLILSLIIFYLFVKIFGIYKGFFAVLLFTFEPFFIGNSRLLHMDVLLTLFLIIGLSFGYLSYRKISFKFCLVSGFFLSLAFLTKSIGILSLIFIFLFSVYLAVFQKNVRFAVKFFILILMSFILTTFLLFPALWINPAVLIDIFKEGERIGIRNGHEQIFFGEFSKDPGMLFYPIVFVLKISLATLIGVLFYIIFSFTRVKKVLNSIRNGNISFILFLSVFYFGYLLAMTFPSKKIDRYMLPLYPYLSLISISGYYYLANSLDKFRKIFYMMVFFIVGIFIIFPLFGLYPYYFTYTNPLFGSPNRANAIIAQKPFGIGIPDLKDFILKKYGDYPALGFIDTKPMRSIYMNSRVFDIRVDGTSNYDLLVLGINEEIPDKVLKSPAKFSLDSIVCINGLDYWRIYAKEIR